MAKLSVLIEMKNDAYVFSFASDPPVRDRVFPTARDALLFLMRKLDQELTRAVETIKAVTPEEPKSLVLNFPATRIKELNEP